VAKDIVLLNSGAAIYAANLANSISEGIIKAEKVIASGAAKQKFDDFVAYTKMIAL
jgi:anthranilate phosphoribosyltransferase